VEAALGGGVILRARDGCFRDIAGLHGTYRIVVETQPALLLIGEKLANVGVRRVEWYLDRPVSNSGKLRKLLLETSVMGQWHWQVHLVPDPDKVLSASSEIVSTADSVILDNCEHWFDIVSEVINSIITRANVVDLRAL